MIAVIVSLAVIADCRDRSHDRRDRRDLRDSARSSRSHSHRDLAMDDVIVVIAVIAVTRRRSVSVRSRRPHGRALAASIPDLKGNFGPQPDATRPRRSLQPAAIGR